MMITDDGDDDGHYQCRLSSLMLLIFIGLCRWWDSFNEYKETNMKDPESGVDQCSYLNESAL